jgi:hypothetical protein
MVAKRLGAAQIRRVQPHNGTTPFPRRDFRPTVSCAYSTSSLNLCAFASLREIFSSLLTGLAASLFRVRRNRERKIIHR